VSKLIAAKSAKYGSDVEGGTPPYARWHSEEVGDDDNSLGIIGPASEEFAIGSTIYYMIKGHEVYGNEWFGEEYLAPDMAAKVQIR
jgi:hypothetical protein